MLPVVKLQRGFAIVSAIFLLVALAALGAFMVSFSNTQHLTSAQDVQGSRAYWAAKGAAQWAASVVVTTGDCPPPGVQPDFNNGFALAVACDVRAYVEGITPRSIYWIRATASAGGAGVGGLGFVEREVQVFME